MSWPPTLDDEPELVRELAVHGTTDPGPLTSVYAPCCGSVVSADQVRDWRGLAKTIIKPDGIGQAQELDWGCDACQARLVRSNLQPWTMAKLVRAYGAPWSDIKRVRVGELVQERRQASTGVFKESSERQSARTSLPDRDIPGTKPVTT